VPPVAWVLSGATGVAVTILAALLLAQRGEHAFFVAGDSKFFLLTARDLFGTGRGFAAINATPQIPYRYGRIGLPFVGWLLALGNPSSVGWTMLVVNLAALTAIPGLAAVVLDDRGAPPAAAAFILVLPAFVLLYGTVLCDPLLIALILVAYILDGRGHEHGAVAVLAYAVLVKEIAVLALVPLAWRALRHGDRRRALGVAGAVVPYALWCVWVQARIGTLPFLARTESRRGALGLPFAGVRYTLAHWPFEGAVIVGLLTVTIVLGAVGAWAARGTELGLLAALLTLMTVCLGPVALRYVGETVRVFLTPEVVGGLALCVGLARRAPSRAAPEMQRDHALSGREHTL